MKKTISITSEGKKNLEKELEELIANRPAITEKIATARAFGDLSENEEYSSARNEQKIAESRIEEIEDILKNAKVIRAGKKDKVSLGSVVKLNFGGREVSYTIVGPTEADPLNGRISDVSPIGKSLLGKKPSDAFEFNGKTIKILEIS